jgi:RimJ/RimL family protein N-acetyltransferase
MMDKILAIDGDAGVGALLPFAPCVEVGWRLNKPFWGKGYATEAATQRIRV